MSQKKSLRKRWKRYAGLLMMRTFFEGLSGMGKLSPKASPARHGVEVLKDIPYKQGGEDFLLDVYKPKELHGKHPILFYVHGGAFQILSKETHWVFGLRFAKQGYIVFNINYRLAPAHRYPAGLRDTMDAFLWVLENAHKYGGDIDQIVLSGESAGANLALGLQLAACYEETEPWAKDVYAANPSLTAIIPACGLLQASDGERFMRRRPIPPFVASRIRGIAPAYIPKDVSFRDVDAVAENYPLADPLVFLERGEQPQRPLPPSFTFVGTKDPILDDTRRYHAALEALGAPSEIKYYPGGLHAFHALTWQERSRVCWQDQYAFLQRVVPTPVKAK